MEGYLQNARENLNDMYGLETVVQTKIQVEMEVTELKMLHFLLGVTRTN